MRSFLESEKRNGVVRIQALGNLAKLGTRGKPALSVVLAFKELLQSPGGFVNSPHAIEVIHTLMAIAPEDKRVYAVLKSCLESGDEPRRNYLVINTQIEVIRALPRTHFNKESVKILIELLRTETNEGLREAVAHALGEIGPDAKDAVKLLEATKIDPSARVREAAGAALKKINGSHISN